MDRTRRSWRLATAVVIIALAAMAPAPAGADPVAAGSASAFALEIRSIDGVIVEPTPVAESPTPAPDEVSSTVIDIPASPLAASGTLIARSAVHDASDLASELVQSEQTVAGPYNARAIGQVEALRALIDEGIPGGELIEADVLRAEAVALCSGGVVTYSAQSEVVNLQIAGNDGLSGPLNDLVAQISAGIDASPLAEVVTVEVNVVEATATGASVDALVVKLFPEASEQDPRAEDPSTQQEPQEPQSVEPQRLAPQDGVEPQPAETQSVEPQQEEEAVPLFEARLGHAEVANVACAPVTDPTVLSNTPLPRTFEHPHTGDTSPSGVAGVLAAGGLALYALRRRIA